MVVEVVMIITIIMTSTTAYGHAKTPILVWSPKLRSVKPDHYLNGGPLGNTLSCNRHPINLPLLLIRPLRKVKKLCTHFCYPLETYFDTIYFKHAVRAKNKQKSHKINTQNNTLATVNLHFKSNLEINYL